MSSLWSFKKLSPCLYKHGVDGKSSYPNHKQSECCCWWLNCFSRVRPATPWAGTHQASLSVGFSRQEDWSGLPFPPLGHLPKPVIEPASLMSPALAGRFFTSSAARKISSWNELLWRVLEPQFIKTAKWDYCVWVKKSVQEAKNEYDYNLKELRIRKTKDRNLGWMEREPRWALWRVQRK